MKIRFVGVVAAIALLAGCAGLHGGADGAATPGSVEQFAQDFTNTGKDRVFFGLDKSDLSAEAIETLKAQAAWFTKYTARKVVIEGHCDERGTREYNLALGERRATAAKDYLIAQGVDANRIKTISYGKERPAVVGNNEAAWAQNRRAVSVVSE